MRAFLTLKPLDGVEKRVLCDAYQPADKCVRVTGGELVNVQERLQIRHLHQIIFFQDERAFKEFTSGNFEFGAQASAVAITAAASASAGTTGGSAGASGGRKDATTAGQYHKGMAVFTIAKGGLMYEAAVGGQKFSFKPL